MFVWILEFVEGAFALLGVVAAYYLFRNQRAAMKSPIIETTNFTPRLASIWEVGAHPDRASTWLREILPGHEEPHLKSWDEKGNARFFRYVFPNLDKDLSESEEIQPDDEEVT